MIRDWVGEKPFLGIFRNAFAGSRDGGIKLQVRIAFVVDEVTEGDCFDQLSTLVSHTLTGTR